MSNKDKITLDKEGLGSPDLPKDFVLIRVKNGNATGLIYKGNQVFAVESLGNYIVAIIELDQSKFPKD